MFAGELSPQSPPGHSSDDFDFRPFLDLLEPLDFLDLDFRDLDFRDLDFSGPQSPPLKIFADLLLEMF